jgi:chemotaxis family two-component system sensor kinase Cph1
MLSATVTTRLDQCDREPIHLSGAIQEHGILLVVDRDSQMVVGEAGDIAHYLGSASVEGRELRAILDDAVLARIELIAAAAPSLLGQYHGANGSLNVVGSFSGAYLLIEMDIAEKEPVDAVQFVLSLDQHQARLEAASSMKLLCELAASLFRQMTQYGRVMVYRFLDDDAGVVVGESRVADADSYLNHHFPASDIPKQARALYVRNRSRVIPDVHYQPQMIRSPRDLSQLDLSDVALRSVSPIHIEYLKNMGVNASASFSIVKDGCLWGLIACHNHEPLHIPLSIRVACQSLANGLARQIKSKEEAEINRERVRLRTQEDRILATFGGDKSLEGFFAKSGELLAKLMAADGFAAVQGKDLFFFGETPEPDHIREIADFVRIPASQTVFTTTSLSRRMTDAERFADKASGLMAVTMSTEVPTILLWFRAEHIELVKWAGNPHKDVPHDPSLRLAPRASFESWTERVRRKARPWSHAQVESASRLVRQILDYRNNQRVRELNRELMTSLRENESLLEQKDYLLREVNHRVQNSLQLVASFLRLQARASQSDAVRDNLGEAQRRLNAVALVHRRLYQDTSVEIVDLSRYLENLICDMLSSMDIAWRDHVSLDLAPILIATDKAVNIGLILTELVINVHKYAYDGAPGPLNVRLEQSRGNLRMIVSDQGRGKLATVVEGTGFGSRLMAALMERLDGELVEEDNGPGLKVILIAPAHSDE